MGELAHNFRTEKSMKHTNNVSRGVNLLAAGVGMALLGLGAPSTALADAVFDLPDGTACHFDLRVSIGSNDQRVNREFLDKAGNTVRILSAGKGDSLSFTNLSSGAALSLKPNGSVTRTLPNPDGSYMSILTGHNVLILFPTDVPAGPTTTLYVGQVVFKSDASNNFTLLSTSGKKMDICAALGG